MSEKVFQASVAKHLKNKRNELGLSLDATAKLTGVSKAMLGQIERLESSPTIATLWKISNGLKTSFSAFLVAEPNKTLQKSNFPHDSQMRVTTLFPYQKDTGMEMFEITLLNQHQQLSEPHQVNTIEHIYVLEGKVSVFFDGKWHTLDTGDGIRFFADQPHGYHAHTNKAVLQNIICYR